MQLLFFILNFYEVERKRGFKWFNENELPGLLHSTHLAKQISQTLPGFPDRISCFFRHKFPQFFFGMNKSHPIVS